MDAVVLIAALILNPIAKRKRAAQTPESMPVTKAPEISGSGAEGLNPAEKFDLESDGSPATDRNLTGIHDSR